MAGFPNSFKVFAYGNGQKITTVIVGILTVLYTPPTRRVPLQPAVLCQVVRGLALSDAWSQDHPTPRIYPLFTPVLQGSTAYI